MGRKYYHLNPDPSPSWSKKYYYHCPKQHILDCIIASPCLIVIYENPPLTKCLYHRSFLWSEENLSYMINHVALKTLLESFCALGKLNSLTKRIMCFFYNHLRVTGWRWFEYQNNIYIVKDFAKILTSLAAFRNRIFILHNEPPHSPHVSLQPKKKFFTEGNK